MRRLELAAAAVLASAGATQRLSVLFLPDLGWVSVALHRRQLAVLVALRAAWKGDVFPTLIVATVSAPGRLEAWRELIAHAAAQRGEPPLPSMVVTWREVRERRLHTVLQNNAWVGQPSENTPSAAQSATRVLAGAGLEQRPVLQLLGRHPFLPLVHLAALLGIRVRDARVRLHRLAEAGLVRWAGGPEDNEHLRLELTPQELAALELSELTRAGLREVAAVLGMPLARAERLHGLIGGGPERPTASRRPLVRALAHTLGADAVFVGLHVALTSIGQNGLVRWDNAAASMRGRCRPDGYGVCHLDGRDVGFFLEYDRGTETARDYAGKWDAYYAYRDSGRAAEDYATLPTILVVTTRSEEPVLRSARAAAMARPAPALPMLVTTTGWIAAYPRGMLGPIWRTLSSPVRGFWLCQRPRRRIQGNGQS